MGKPYIELQINVAGDYSFGYCTTTNFNSQEISLTNPMATSSPFLFFRETNKLDQNEEFDKRVEFLKGRHELEKSLWEKQINEDKIAEIAHWRSEIGDVVEAMLDSYSAALEAAAISGKSQTVAIEILAHHWKRSGTTEVLELLQTVIGSSTNAKVREVAIFAVSHGLLRSMNRYWLSYLAAIVSDEKESVLVRRAGYVGIHFIVGKSLPNIKELVKFSLAEIDWKFVADCASGQIETPSRETWEI